MGSEKTTFHGLHYVGLCILSSTRMLPSPIFIQGTIFPRNLGISRKREGQRSDKASPAVENQCRATEQRGFLPTSASAAARNYLGSRLTWKGYLRMLLNRWLAELLSGYETGQCGRPRSTGLGLRVHSKRETRALHLFSLAVFFIKSCSKRPGEEKKYTEVFLTSHFRLYTFQRKWKRPKSAWAKACDRTCKLYLSRTSHVKT